jgi:hypothetical protein
MNIDVWSRPIYKLDCLCDTVKVRVPVVASALFVFIEQSKLTIISRTDIGGNRK